MSNITPTNQTVQEDQQYTDTGLCNIDKYAPRGQAKYKAIQAKTDRPKVLPYPTLKELVMPPLKACKAIPELPPLPRLKPYFWLLKKEN